LKPLFQKISISDYQSIFVKDTFDTNFHFHGEYELIYFSEGYGECIIGDRVTNYEPGSLFLIAPNLPHQFSNSPSSTPKSLVIQFKHKIFNQIAQSLPELATVKTLLENSKRGLLFNKSPNKFDKLIITKDFERFVKLLEILKKLSLSEKYDTLSSPAFTPVKLKDYNQINKVYEYVANHYHEKIILDDVAKKMHMTTSTFCRYFKKITKKSFVSYLNEYRIGKACNFLKQNDKNISEICYKSGYESIANFNRQFKKQVNLSPREYRKKHNQI